MVAYGEFRQSFDKDPVDHRVVFYGIRYLIENYVGRKWTREDVERSAEFYQTHNVGYGAFPFPKELFLKVEMSVLECAFVVLFCSCCSCLYYSYC